MCAVVSITMAPKEVAHASTVQALFERYQPVITQSLQDSISEISAATGSPDPTALIPYYGQMSYHLGWVDAAFQPIQHHTGKMLRPTLLLLSYELASAQMECTHTEHSKDLLQRALPAACAIELAHNFTLIHDDIEDSDEERRHRPTLWKLWGVPHAINTGDGMHALARHTLWKSLDAGVPLETVLRIARLFDHTLLTIIEGQHLDLHFETLLQVQPDMYLDMIGRKTAALLRCSTEMGATLGCQDEATIVGLRRFGWILGLAFQVRDDLLGTWASLQQSGKMSSGDLYRRKKSLPIIHALNTANARDQRQLLAVYTQTTPVTVEQVAELLTIFERTRTKQYCQEMLSLHCRQARQTLEELPVHPGSSCAHANLETLLMFVEQMVV